MSYRIVYGTDKKPQNPQKRLRTGILLAVTACFLLGIFGYLGGGDIIGNWLLPGDSAVTGAALESMADSLQNGEKLADAVTAFCLEILNHAQIPE